VLDLHQSPGYNGYLDSYQEQPMPKRYSIAQARQNFAAIVHELEAQPLIELTRRGEPVAVLLGIAAYRRLQPATADFWSAYEAFRASLSAEDLADPDQADPCTNLRDRSPGREVDL
jgi:prevent-host-death family protein